MNFSSTSPLALAKFEGKSDEEKVELLLFIIQNFKAIRPFHGTMDFLFLYEVDLKNARPFKRPDRIRLATRKILDGWDKILDLKKSEKDYVIMEVMWSDEKKSFLTTLRSNRIETHEYPVGTRAVKEVLHLILYLGRDVHGFTIPK